MTIGMLTGGAFPHLVESLQTVYRLTEGALCSHRLIYRGDEYWQAPGAVRDEMNRNLLARANLILGPVDADLLRARDLYKRPVPFLYFLEGSTCRGLPVLRDTWQLLRRFDCLVGNCTADEAILRKFFGDAVHIEILPFPYDDEVFRGRDSDACERSRRELDIPPEDHIVLYAGRVLLEKNLHTSLKVFSILQRILPRCHFLIAGEVLNTPFFEFGVYVVNLERWLRKLVPLLGIDPRRVRFLGKLSPVDLRHVYCAADVLLNLTLHHDENFGLAQVEAMACGTPVVASQWGGLRDTVQTGRTGHCIRASMTASGLKLDWLSAVSALKQLLGTSKAERKRISNECTRRARTEYGPAVYKSRLQAILGKVSDSPQDERAPTATPFADAYWQHLPRPEQAPTPGYARSDAAFSFYRKLATYYAGHSTIDMPASQVGEQDLLYMTCKVGRLRGGALTIDDPLALRHASLPSDQRLRQAVTRILSAFDTAALMTLRSSGISKEPASSDGAALEWLLRQGLVTVCTQPPRERISSNILMKARRSWFHTHEVNIDTDAVVFRRSTAAT